MLSVQYTVFSVLSRCLSSHHSNVDVVYICLCAGDDRKSPVGVQLNWNWIHWMCTTTHTHTYDTKQHLILSSCAIGNVSGGDGDGNIVCAVFGCDANGELIEFHKFILGAAAFSRRFWCNWTLPRYYVQSTDALSKVKSLHIMLFMDISFSNEHRFIDSMVCLWVASWLLWPNVHPFDSVFGQKSIQYCQLPIANSWLRRCSGSVSTRAAGRLINANSISQ